MLVLSTLHRLLSQILSLPELHTALLLTPGGQLVSFASDPARPKDEILVVVGLSGAVWQETEEQGLGMVDSELGRILVMPVQDTDSEHTPTSTGDGRQPLMLLALNATDAVEWDDLKAKAKVLASHLAQPLSKHREHLTVPPTSPLSTAPSPDRPGH